RMRQPQPLPVIVELDLNGLVPPVDMAREELLDPRVLGEGNVRPEVEEKALVVPNRSGMPPEERILVVDARPDIVVVQEGCRAEAGHAASDHDDVLVQILL